MKITVTYRINPNNTKEKYVIAVLDSADDLLFLADSIKECDFCIENVSLYKYSKKYIILFPDNFTIGKNIFRIKEFAKIRFICEKTVAHIKEYGILLCDNLKPILK